MDLPANYLQVKHFFDFQKNAIPVLRRRRLSRLVVGGDCLASRCQCCQSASTDSRGEICSQLRPPTRLGLGDKISLVLVKNCMVLVKRKLGLVKNKLGLGEKKSLVCIVIIK